MEMCLIAIVIMGLICIKEKGRHLLRIEWPKVGGFVGFLTFVVLLRLALMDWLINNDPSYIVPSNDFSNIPFWSFALVFWEDVFFGLPIYYVMKHTKFHILNKIAFVLAISMIFGAGHSYQGLSAVFITSLYPFFASYRYGSKVGFGTVMVGHIMYDYCVFFMLYLLPYILPSYH